MGQFSVEKTTEGNGLDGNQLHAAPPLYLKKVYKKYQLIKDDELKHDQTVVDLGMDAQTGPVTGWREIGSISSDHLKQICHEFDQLDGPLAIEEDDLDSAQDSFSAYEYNLLPGLRIFPSLIPRRTQLQLLSRLLHRDLSNQNHRTNAHLHYHMEPPDTHTGEPYTATAENAHGTSDNTFLANSYFNYDPSSSRSFPARDPALHSPLSASKLISKKLRWITLGGQYDWTRKIYHQGPAPPFPEDIADLVQGLFPQMKAEAAIVNLYSPGDALSLHRDISERSGNELISISLGCDGIFVIGPNTHVDADQPPLAPDDHPEGAAYAALRLRSGDVLCMSGEARFAWHGLPKVVAGTCPEWMKDWPARQRSDGNEATSSDMLDFEGWRSWMATKRINLNVRQMFD